MGWNGLWDFHQIKWFPVQTPKTLSQVLGTNLVTRLPVNLGSKMTIMQWLTLGKWGSKNWLRGSQKLPTFSIKVSQLARLKKKYFQAWLGAETTPAFYHDDGEAFWRFVSCTNRGYNAISRARFSEPCRLRDQGKETKF